MAYAGRETASYQPAGTRHTETGTTLNYQEMTQGHNTKIKVRTTIQTRLKWYQ